MSRTITYQIRLGQAKELTQKIAERIPEAMVRSMRSSLRLVGNVTAGEYMRRVPKSPFAGRDIHPTMVTVRSGRLMRSFINPGEEGIQEIVAVSDTVLKGTIGSRVVYGARQEYGGQFPISKRAQGFFWFKYKMTGDSLWRGLAVKGLRGQPIITPPRPFLSRAMEDPDVRIGIQNILADELGNAFSVDLVTQ